METGKRKKENGNWIYCYHSINLFLLFLLFFINSCGHKQNPAGGKKDTIKPEIVNIFPEEFSDIGDQNIEVTFSKPIDRTTILTGMSIYPPILKKKFKWDKNNLIIKIYEELELNTNYFFTFSQDIQGEHNNELDQKYIFIFKSGKLNENRISGNISYELDEDRNKPVTFELMTADSIGIVSKTVKGPTYEFSYLNEIEHQLIAFIDKDNNQRYNSDKEPFFKSFVKPEKFTNLNFEMTYVDTLKPKIESVNVLFNNLIELKFSEKISDYSTILIVSDDSLKSELSIIADQLMTDKLLLLSAETDTIRYITSITDLQDRKGNAADTSYIFFDGSSRIDSTPPAIVSIYPKNGATINTLQPDIEITFSEIILEDNFDISLIATEEGKRIPLINFISNSNRLVFKPKFKLTNYSTYKIIANASDLNSNKMENFESVFIPIVR